MKRILLGQYVAVFGGLVLSSACTNSPATERCPAFNITGPSTEPVADDWRARVVKHVEGLPGETVIKAVALGTRDSTLFSGYDTQIVYVFQGQSAITVKMTAANWKKFASDDTDPNHVIGDVQFGQPMQEFCSR